MHAFVCIWVFLCVGDIRLVTPAWHGLYRRAHGYVCSSSFGSWHGGTDAAGPTLLNLARHSAHHHIHGYTGMTFIRNTHITTHTSKLAILFYPSVLQKKKNIGLAQTFGFCTSGREFKSQAVIPHLPLNWCMQRIINPALTQLWAFKGILMEYKNNTGQYVPSQLWLAVLPYLYRSVT